MTGFVDDAWQLVTDARQRYRDNPDAAALLDRQLDRFGQPLRIAVTGTPLAGRSTLIEALVSDLGVDRPARALRHATFLEPAADDPDADAVLYLTPHVSDADLRALRAGQSSPSARATPVDTIRVLARADEAGAGRVEGLSAARVTARRYRRDPEVRQLCQTVIAVSGLLAQAGRTLREEEFTALATLAGTDLDGYLLSVDRFVQPDFPVPLYPAVRAALLDRFGLAGVRLATTLIRTGSASPGALSAQLIARSGLTELREAIGQLFLARRGALQARSALLALESVLRTAPHPDTGDLSSELERIVANAHELRELRLLGTLGTRRTGLPADLAAEARRLAGADGTTIPARLGIDESTPPEQAWDLAMDAVRRWRATADEPAYRQDERRAALVVARTCEAILAELARTG